MIITVVALKQLLLGQRNRFSFHDSHATSLGLCDSILTINFCILHFAQRSRRSRKNGKNSFRLELVCEFLKSIFMYQYRLNWLECNLWLLKLTGKNQYQSKRRRPLILNRYDLISMLLWYVFAFV